MTTGVYDIQWASSPTVYWYNAWDHLRNIPAYAGKQSAEVPRYYRVVHKEIANTNAIVVLNEIAATFTEGSITFSGILAHSNIVPGTVTFAAKRYDGSTMATFVDNGDRVLYGTDGASGLIIYSTGAWYISTLLSPVMSDGHLRASYSYYDDNP